MSTNEKDGDDGEHFTPTEFDFNAPLELEAKALVLEHHRLASCTDLPDPGDSEAVSRTQSMLQENIDRIVGFIPAFQEGQEIVVSPLSIVHLVGRDQTMRSRLDAEESLSGEVSYFRVGNFPTEEYPACDKNKLVLDETNQDPYSLLLVLEQPVYSPGQGKDSLPFPGKVAVISLSYESTNIGEE